MAIKKIDPELTVVLGGTAGIPMEFFEEILKAGGGAYFDVINIHPYRFPYSPETVSLYNDVQKLKALMKKYGVDKDVYISEMGWPTHDASDVSEIINAGLDALGCSRENQKVAALVDPNWGYGEQLFANNARNLFHDVARFDEITLDDLTNLSPSDFQVLMLPSEEFFPMVYFPKLEEYIAKGGIVIFSKGVPLYYDLIRAGDGTTSTVKVGEVYRKRLHIGWDAYWTREGVPTDTLEAEPGEKFKDTLEINTLRSSKYFTEAALLGDDCMIPVVYGKKGEFRGCIVAAYKYNSNLKGGVIAISSGAIGGGVTDEIQAEMLPRSYLLAFQAGVKKMFWYELQSSGGPAHDRECYFGILNQDLSIKPAFTAYSTLVKMRPTGSSEQTIHKTSTGVFLASWKKPDGTKVWALWSVDDIKDCILSIEGTVTTVVNHLGMPKVFKQVDKNVKVEASPGIIYITGPTNVSLMNSAEMK